MKTNPPRFICGHCRAVVTPPAQMGHRLVSWCASCKASVACDASVIR